MTWPPEDCTSRTFPKGTGEARDHRYYVVDRHGGSAPSVLLMHEFPGISDPLGTLANELAEDFRVVIPSILGRDGDPSMLGSAVELCVRREVELLRTGRDSKAVPWLQRFLVEVVSQGRPCGVVGMCMTGGFALALAVDPTVRAAVIAQPAMPPETLLGIPLPGRARRAADLGLSPERREALQERLREDPGCLRARGYRFEHDETSPPEKLASARELLGDAMVVAPPLHSENPKAHSTLTKDRDDGAVAEVRAFLRERLAAPA